MGTIYHCPSYVSHGRACVNHSGQVYKDYAYIIEDSRTQLFLDRREYLIPGGWKAEIARGFKGYCNNCMEGRSEPMDMRAREDFLDVYLGKYDSWGRRKGEAEEAGCGAGEANGGDPKGEDGERSMDRGRMRLIAETTSVRMLRGPGVDGRTQVLKLEHTICRQMAW